MDICRAQTAAKLKNILQNIDQSEYLLPKHEKFKFYLKQLLAKAFWPNVLTWYPFLILCTTVSNAVSFFFLFRFMYFIVGRGCIFTNRAIHKVGNRAIHKAAGLTVPGHSMTLPGTIPENLLSHEWGQRLEWSEVLPTTGRMLDSGFVNSTIILKYFIFNGARGLLPSDRLLRKIILLIPD